VNQILDYLKNNPWAPYDQVIADAPAGADTRKALNEILKSGKAELRLSYDYSTQCVVLP
jgi:hypothetical protein